ncbi:hypothetical protein Pfo_026078 [Paulownia fortunei]|nr:hypothetical protein Pfo_026078 [Paulownia fortunei]
MFSSFYIAFIRRNFSVRVVSPTQKPCFLQLSPFSSAANATPNSISKISNQNSFIVNYLISTFGFSPEKAFSASKYLDFESTEKPDSVIAFLKNRGFTHEQIGRLVRNFPPMILRDPQKVLLPKIEFFQSLGIPETEVTKIFLITPSMFGRSLERQIAPSFNYIKSLFDANGTSLGFLKRATETLCCNLQSRLLPNVEVLKEAGVPGSKIVYLLQYYPRAVMADAERFRKFVEDVKELGLNPSGSTFVIAVYVFLVISKSNWEKKVAVYKKWGISEDEILSAFGKHPHCMTKSIDKIMAAMDFFVNKMGLHSSFVLKAPALVSYSLDKRIKPRSSVYKILVDNGLIKKGSLLSMYKCAEKDFLRKYVQCYEEVAPGLLELYQKELAAIQKVKICKK